MLNMNGKLGLHIIQAPSGRFIYVGSIPTALGEAIPASKAAVMGQRAFRGEDGGIYEWKFPAFDSYEAAEAFANAQGYEVIQ